jgi:pimeloyl-ACP methyl ester carboxylesterase
MKKILFFGAFMCFMNTFAQISKQLQLQSQSISVPVNPTPLSSVSTISTTEEPPNWSVMLANLPVSQITSGVLLDKVSDFSNLTNYNTLEKNLSDSKHFNQALTELYKASDQALFISKETLATRTAYSTNANSVDVGIINTLFHRLNFNEDDATLSGLTYLNNQFSTVAGKPSFVSKKIIVASPLKEFVSGTSIDFNFNDTFIFNNATTLIKNLTVKFEENATNTAVTIIYNGAFVISTKNIVYTTSGYKTLTFTTTFSDNTVITTYGKIYVTVLSAPTASFTTTINDLCSDPLREKGIFTALETDNSTSFQGYNETYAFKGKIEYSVFYSNNNNAHQMLKPLIIVDGFDPRDKRKVQDCDCENDPTCKLANSDISFSLTRNPMLQITFNPIKHVSIEDSMEYPVSSTTTKNFLSDLRTLGYDVIIINQPTYEITNPVQPTIQVWVPTRFFPTVLGHWETRPNTRVIDGGADYIERNAYTLASFIKNFVKPRQVTAASTQKLVVIGPSMGGQITRYALAYMEKKFALTGDINWKHNTRLWVSVDSPHLGANIPVGGQANIWFMADKMYNAKAQDSYADLNSVAGQQMSITNFENARVSSNHNLEGSSFFTTYYNSLNSNGVAGSNGYPVTIPNTFRKIAMTNGSLTGAKQGTEGQTFLYTRVYIRGLWPFQSSTITLARFRDSFLPSFGSTGQVFQGDGQNFNIGLNHWYISHPRYTLNVNNQDIRGSFDVVPGGYFKLGEILKTSIEGGASDGGFRSETTDYLESNSFISAFSALGHLSPWQNWANPLNTNLTCSTNKLTPFDSYFGASNNSEHTSFTKEGVAWLTKELAGNPQAPSFPIDPNALTGPAIICKNETKTYSFDDACKITGTVTSWNVTENANVISSTNTSVTIKGNSEGLFTITANFSNGQTVSRIIRMLREPQFSIRQYTHVGTDGYYLQLVAPIGRPFNEQFIESITWQNLIGGGCGSLQYTPGNSFTNFLVCPPINENCPYENSCKRDIKVILTNACGTKEYFASVGFGQNPNARGVNNNLYKIYPNPSNTIINVSLLDDTLRPETTSTIIAELFDMMGQPRKNVQVINNIASIDVSGLPKGIYVLKINIDGVIESHQVGVQ